MDDADKLTLTTMLEMCRELYADNETGEAESILDDIVALIEEM